MDERPQPKTTAVIQLAHIDNTRRHTAVETTTLNANSLFHTYILIKLVCRIETRGAIQSAPKRNHTNSGEETTQLDLHV